MRGTIHFIVIMTCLVATFFLYNKQMGSIPLIILSIYLFYLGFLKLRDAKNSKSQ